MRWNLLAFCLVVAVSSVVAAEEPAVTPFWMLPKSELNLRGLVPADVKLIATPNRSREFGLLQFGMMDVARDLSRIRRSADSGYRIVPGGLKVGELVFGAGQGVPEKFEEIPAELLGLTLLQTNELHTAVLDGRFAIVLSTAKPCTVFLAVNDLALETYKTRGAPAWLQEFAPTGLSLKSNETDYQVFVKQAPAGRIVFGPPCSNWDDDWMYFAFFAEAK